MAADPAPQATPGQAASVLTLPGEWEALASELLKPVPDDGDPLGRPRQRSFAEGASAGTLRECARELRERLADPKTAFGLLLGKYEDAKRERDAARGDAAALRASARDDTTTIEGLTAERDHYRQQAAALREQLAKMDRDAAKAIAAESRVVASLERSLYAALIDVWHGDPADAGPILQEALDGYDGPQWNGAETGTEWLERTEADARAALEVAPGGGGQAADGSHG